MTMMTMMTMKWNAWYNEQVEMVCCVVGDATTRMVDYSRGTLSSQTAGLPLPIWWAGMAGVGGGYGGG